MTYQEIIQAIENSPNYKTHGAPDKEEKLQPDSSIVKPLAEVYEISVGFQNSSGEMKVTTVKVYGLLDAEGMPTGEYQFMEGHHPDTVGKFEEDTNI